MTGRRTLNICVLRALVLLIAVTTVLISLALQRSKRTLASAFLWPNRRARNQTPLSQTLEISFSCRQ